MGTNYYRIPSEKEFSELKKVIINHLNELDDFSFSDNFSECFGDVINYDYKDEEGHKLKVHLGKRSGGWKFLWNFHRNKFYHDKKSLIEFIKGGRIFDEYGEEWTSEEFINMAMNWCPDGYDSENYPDKNSFIDWHDLFIDGLRVSNPSNESTYFS